MAYFPMFVQLKKKKCLVIGGGKIALRKIEVLKDFEADITVIAPEMITQIRQIDQICRIFRTFMEKDFNEADFDSNGDCHITIFQNGKNNDLCIHPDGSYESEEIEDEKIDQFQVLKSNDFIFYYSLVDDSYGGFLFMNGEQSDRAYVIEAESDLYLSEDKFILIENQKAYDYELIENTILCLDENEIMGLEVIAYLPDLVVCRDIQTKTSGVGEMSDLIVFVRENALEAE